MGFIGLYSTGQFKLLSTSPQGEEAGSGPTEAFSNYKSVTAVQRWPTGVQFIHHCKQKIRSRLD
jgi:hypothetical protein